MHKITSDSKTYRKERKGKYLFIKNDEFIELPNFHLNINETPEKAIKHNFLKEFTEEQFEQICKTANSTDFLIGVNDKGWKADFDFLMRTDKAISVLEGKYKTNSKKEKKGSFEQREYSDLSRLYANGGQNEE